MPRRVKSRVVLGAAMLSLLAWALSEIAVAQSSAASPAIVHVVQAGGTASTSDHVTWAGNYGVVLRNTSSTRDALDVDVVVKFYAPSGKLVGKDPSNPLVAAVDRLTVIPAGATFYFGGEALPLTGPIARVETTLRVGKTAPAGAVLPQMRNVKLIRAPLIKLSAKERIAQATLVNATHTTLKAGTSRSYAVFFNRAGKVIGGDPTGTPIRAGVLDANVPAGQTATVRWEDIVSPTVAWVRASTDPGSIAH
jgi:hypothetical protein